MHTGDRFSRGGTASPTSTVDTSKLYETLGVEKTATLQEVKKAFRKLAVIHHPDKGGDEQTFQEINAAYQVLSDEEKRKKYDSLGLEGLKDAQQDQTSPDIFDIFFRHPRGNAPPRRRAKDVNHALPLTLEDLYNGKTIQMAIHRSILVGEPPVHCQTCNGRGVVLQIRQLGLDMIQQVKCACPDCQGQGCRVTRQKERHKVDVTVEKGMLHGDKIVLTGMGDEQPHSEPGNVNFVIQQRPHETFKRKGADLLIHKQLTLNEALTGYSFAITHLDKRRVVIQSKPGEIIPPMTLQGKPFVKMIPNEGMPSRGNPFVRGNLYVHFTVQFPSDGELSDEAVDALRKCLPGRAADKSIDQQANDPDFHQEVAHCEHTDLRNFGKGGITARESDSDSDDTTRPEGVQCQQS